MASRKEDEKNEKIIRNLLKLPANRRCINCNSLGPQYVCINFWTFICTNCSGIHREFTHRVKSVSMAKFTSQEVSALQGGGNASAKEIYFKEWDPQRQSLPDGSNVERLRDFIKHVYVERRYTGERSFDKPPKAKMSESEDFNDNRRMDYYQSGSRSPPSDEANERHNSDRLSSGGRSPGYDMENRQHGDYKKSPARTEVVNDWRREDRFGNGRRSDDNRTSDGASRPLDTRSPDRQKDLGASSPPVVRPVREILGENVTPLRIEPPKANGIRSSDTSIRTQRTESSSSLASSNGNPAELRVETSLIDFDAVPEPPVVPSVPQPQQQQPAGRMPLLQTAHSGGDNWANFDSVMEVKVSHAAGYHNPLEAVISELSVPASVPLNLVGNPGNAALTSAATASSNLSGFPTISPVTSFGSPYSTAAFAASAVNNSAAFPFGIPAANAQPVLQQPIPGSHSFGTASSVGLHPQSQQYYTTPIGNSNNQPSNPVVVPNSQWLSGAPTGQTLPPGVRPSVEFGASVSTQSSSPEVKFSGRKELPEDLFAVNYSSMSVPIRGWHAGPQPGAGFAMQYNMPVPLPTIPQASKSVNPFDVSSDPSPASTFPSMSSLQGALPTMTAPGGQLHPSSLPTPASHPSALFSHAQPHAALMPPNAYLGQQPPFNMPSRPHGQVQFGLDGAAFGAPSANSPIGGLQSTTVAPNSFSSIGGNPFG